jgi:proteasome lid subunit RPN8/RPN11
MAIELRQQDVERIHQHGVAAYPSECCGFLLGRQEGDRRIVMEVAPMPNAWQSSEYNPYEKRPQDSTENRSMVDPRDYLRTERHAREKGIEILSFYHSHPDHPAQPSEFDQRNALPFFIYVILAVEKGIPREMTAWLLNEDGSRFLSEPLSIQ